MPGSPPLPQRLLTPCLAVWLAGVQVHELFAAGGAWATVACALAIVARERSWAWWRGFAVLFGFVALSLVAPLLAGRAPTALGVARLADWLVLPGAFLALQRVDAKGLARVGAVAAAVLLVSCALAALQHFGAWPKREAFDALKWTGVGFHRVYETVPGRGDRFMAGGLLLHRLKFANVTAVVCVLGAAVAAAGAPRRWGWAAVVALGLVSIAVFPHARAAMAAGVLAAAVAVVVAAADRKRALLVAGAAVLVIAGAALATPSMRERLLGSFTGEGSGERGIIVEAGLAAVADHPLAGVGLGQFRPALYAPPDAPTPVLEHVGKAHDQFVSIAAETGLPSLLLLLGFLVLYGRRALQAGRPGAAAVGALTLFVLLSLLHDPLFHAESSLALMLALGGALGWAERLSPPSAPA